MSKSSTSKTARASAPKFVAKLSDEQKVAEAARAAAPRLIPLANGAGVYFFEPLSNTMVRLTVASDTFVETLRPACALGMASRIRRELEGFAADHPAHGWDSAIARLEQAGVLAVSEDAQAA